MSDPLNYDIGEFCTDYSAHDILIKYVKHFKEARPQTKANLKTFIDELSNDFKMTMTILATYCGIASKINIILDEHIGMKLFIRAVSIHKDQKLASRIVSSTKCDYESNFSMLLSITSDENILKAFLTSVSNARTAIGIGFKGVVHLFNKNFPEICGQWFDENIDKQYHNIVVYMTSDVVSANMLIDLIDIKNRDDLLMKRIIKLDDDKLIVAAAKKYFT